MLGSVISLVALQYGALGGGEVGTLITQMESMGFFTYMIPFLLIFALVFGLLTRMGIFVTHGQGGAATPNVGVNAIIALGVSLLSLQFDFVPRFFSEIFPRLGVGLAVILVLIILVGMFMPNRGFMTYILLGIAGLTFLIIINNSFADLGWAQTSFIYEYKNLLIGLAVMGLVLAIVIGFSTPTDPHNIPTSPLTRIIDLIGAGQHHA